MGMLSRYQKSGGFIQLLQLIETCGKVKQDNFLQIIEKEDTKWAEALRTKMLTIEKILSWNSPTIAEIAVRLHELTLATSLHGLKPTDGEKLLQTFTHSQKRNIEDLRKSKVPTQAEISAAYLKILVEVRSMITHGYIRLETVAPELIIPKDIEDELGKNIVQKTAEMSTPSAGSGQGSAEVHALKAKVQALTNENTQLKSELKVLREKIAHINVGEKINLAKNILVFTVAPILTALTLTMNTVYAEDSCVGTKFSGAEHKQLGDLGFQQACKATDVISDCTRFSVQRQDNKRNFSYGDLVTLGDFFKNPIVAYTDTTPISRLDNVFRCIDKEGRVQQEQKTHPEVKYPNCTWVYLSNIKSFLELASTNDNHFVWNNIKTYVKYHAIAIEIAQSGHLKQDYTLLNKALFINGVADHYLTDAFPSGHLRVPRAQIRNWAIKKSGGIFRKYIADAISMILHDHEGKDFDGNDVGIAVKNSRGDTWITHSDSSLNICRADSDDSIRLPTEAIALSSTDILLAFKTGMAPTEVYPSLFIVPTAIEKELLSSYLNGRNLYEKSTLNSLQEGLPLPLRLILSNSDLNRFFRNLPSLQEQFAQSVEQDVLQNPELALRIPQGYIKSLTSTKD